MKHKDSQKRIYIKNAIYFITTNVDEPLYPFKEDLFCDLFVADMEFCREIKQFNIFGYKVNPDHIHLLMQPTGEKNYSEIMRSLKTNFSRNVNYILGYNDIPRFLKARSRDLAFKKHYDFIIHSKTKFCEKYFDKQTSKFQWQSSFNDHIIRNKADYYMRLNYIKSQWKKHELKENKCCFISKMIPDLSYTKQLKFTS